MPYRTGGTKRRRPAGGYGGTKRRRYNRRSYLKRFSSHRRKLSRRPRLAPLYRPVRMGLNQPVRIMVKHTNIMSITVSNTTATFSNNVLTILPLRLRDAQTAAVTERSPMNYTDYSRLYVNYRVHGVKITAYFSDMDNDANDAFISCFYSVPGINDETQPADPYTVTTASTADAFLQEKGIRKQRMVGSGAMNAVRSTIHNSGYWAMKRIQNDLTQDAHISEGEVAVDGSAVSDPAMKPLLIHKLVAQPTGGFGNAHNFSVRYKLTFFVEWFNRRRVFEPEVI